MAKRKLKDNGFLYTWKEIVEIMSLGDKHADGKRRDIELTEVRCSGYYIRHTLFNRDLYMGHTCIASLHIPAWSKPEWVFGVGVLKTEDEDNLRFVKKLPDGLIYLNDMFEAMNIPLKYTAHPYPRGLGIEWTDAKGRAEWEPLGEARVDLHESEHNTGEFYVSYSKAPVKRNRVLENPAKIPKPEVHSL